MMRYLLFVSLAIGLEGFSPIHYVHPALSSDCLESSVPKFSSVLFASSVDVVGHHISGLLFLKVMPDSSRRAVFSNEAGITYFDFEWKKNGEFKTYHVIKKLRKRIVLNTLRKDFELMLVPPALIKSIEKKGADGGYSAVRKREKLMFKTTADCRSIVSVDVIGRKSKLVTVRFFPEGKNIPDSVSIVHFNFNMKIGLKRLAQ
ncbi:MAG TPA: hypothetical protein VL728_09985 [Cyclobacteriaceae bacterium]|nr:hypothetical protein [Cyclobacteriaceae bacterium]